MKVGSDGYTYELIEDFDDATVSANDCFRPVVRYFDRISRPEHILTALPRALRVMTDPANCGPVCLAFCQDTQAEAYDYPVEFFEPKTSRPPAVNVQLNSVSATRKSLVVTLDPSEVDAEHKAVVVTIVDDAAFDDDAGVADEDAIARRVLHFDAADVPMIAAHIKCLIAASHRCEIEHRRFSRIRPHADGICRRRRLPGLTCALNE